MKFKFSEDKTYNPIGANHTRVHAKKGDVHDLPPYLCRMLQSAGAGDVVGAEPSEQPSAGPSQRKSVDMLAKEAAQKVTEFDDKDALMEFVSEDERVTVQRAAEDRLEQLN